MFKTKKRRALFIKKAIKLLSVFIILIIILATFIPKAIDMMGFGPKPPVFRFESSLAPGWVSEGNFNPRLSMGEQYSQDQLLHLPLATVSVLQKDSDVSDDCFVAFSYFDKLVDTAKLLEKIEKQTQEDKTLVVNKLSPYSSRLYTPEGYKQYTLHQFDLQGPEAEKMLRGAAHGYIELSDSYIEIRAYCSSSEGLASLTLPLGMGAIKLVE